MKSFENNLQGNRLYCPEVAQCFVVLGRPEESHFPSSSARVGTACTQPRPLLRRVRCRVVHGLQYLFSVILLQVCTSPFLSTDSFCRTAKIDGRCIKQVHPVLLWEFIILNTEGGRGGDVFPGEPFSGEEFWFWFFHALKVGRGECWSRSRVSDSKHNTLFIGGRHLHDARGGKKCTLLYQKLFQYYGNAHFKRVNCKFCAACGGALFS